MIIGVGTDIVAVSRIKRLMDEHPQRFIERILSRYEQTAFNGCQNKSAYLAKRFATKEAFGKAMGTGIGDGMAFNEIETQHDDSGQPKLVLHGQALFLANAKGVAGVHLSVSDETDYATAFVILSAAF